MFKIKVYYQVAPKYLAGDLIVSTNRYIESYKKVADLKYQDTFLYDGVYYMVESIEKI
jgi:hypothetical protein